MLLGAAYVLAPDRAKLAASAPYMLIGLAAAFVLFLNREDIIQRGFYPALVVSAAVGLLALSGGNVWEWWPFFVMLSFLPVALAYALNLPDGLRRYEPFIYAVAALAGLLLAGSPPVDVALLGLGLLVGGHGLLWLLAAETRKSVNAPAESAVQVESPASESMYEAPSDEQELLTRIHVTVDGLVRAAQAINDVTTQQSSGATEQVDVIQMTNEMMESFLAMSESVSQQARAMNQAAEETAAISEDGQTAIHEAMQGMERIREQVNEIGATIVSLAQFTRRIDEIITSVSEIATQSNLLALNASIEAARAGTGGRGFAVVADEVRALSMQSTRAASQVRAILAEIQSAVGQTVSAAEAGTLEADAGLEVTRKADDIMQQLVQNMNASSGAVRAIYDVIRQQVDGLEEIAINMERIDRITQQNLASTRTITTVSTNLTRLADDLQSVTIGHADKTPQPAE